MKLIKDFGVRALLATMLVIILAIIIIPASLSGRLEAVKAAEIVSPLIVIALGFYFSRRATP